MGCDIHIYVERPTEAGWEMVDPPAIYWRSYWVSDDYPWKEWPDDRSYYVFSRLAGVRYYGDEREGQVRGPDPRGLPDDLSDGVRGAMADGGEHSHSWAMWPEFRAALVAEGASPKPPEETDRSWGHGFDQLIYELDRRDDNDKLRIVYAFDS